MIFHSSCIIWPSMTCEVIIVWFFFAKSLYLKGWKRVALGCPWSIVGNQFIVSRAVAWIGCLSILLYLIIALICRPLTETTRDSPFCCSIAGATWWYTWCSGCVSTCACWNITWTCRSNNQACEHGTSTCKIVSWPTKVSGLDLICVNLSNVSFSSWFFEGEPWGCLFRIWTSYRHWKRKGALAESAIIACTVLSVFVLGIVLLCLVLSSFYIFVSSNWLLPFPSCCSVRLPIVVINYRYCFASEMFMEIGI